MNNFHIFICHPFIFLAQCLFKYFATFNWIGCLPTLKFLRVLYTVGPWMGGTRGTHPLPVKNPRLTLQTALCICVSTPVDSTNRGSNSTTVQIYWKTYTYKQTLTIQTNAFRVNNIFWIQVYCEISYLQIFYSSVLLVFFFFILIIYFHKAFLKIQIKFCLIILSLTIVFGIVYENLLPNSSSWKLSNKNFMFLGFTYSSRIIWIIFYIIYEV